MRSNAGIPQPSAAAIAAKLGEAIDELAAAARSGHEADSEELAARLASVWALITATDPEVAARLARYSP